MGPVLNIRLFASFQVVYDGELISSIRSAPMQSLLAYLLLHRESPQSRQQLAYLLWPESSEAQARTNLRRELHHLRQALPDADNFLQIDAKFIQWRSGAPFTLDVAEFEAGIAEVEATGDRAALLVLLERAITLYAGDLLPSCYDDWIVTERERLSQSYARLMESLIQVLEQERNYAQAIHYAQRFRRYDPLHEPTYRYLMRLYSITGDRALALRVYHTCVTTLRRELGVPPGSATRELYERLIATGYRSPQPRESTATVVAEERLVGRQPEWEIVQAVWHETARGQAHVVLITGDAGIGKSRLLEEMLEWADRQGIATARSRCYAAQGGLAYGPVADWLAADTFRTALLTLDPVWLTEVARLLPGLLVERPELPRPAPLTESGQRLRLFKALVQVVLAESQPLILAIDDLQWCDRETLEWLNYLLRGSIPRRLLIVGAARTDEVAANHPLWSLLMNLRSTEQVTEVELGPLNPKATAEMAAQVVGRDLPPDLAARIYAETEGYPLFIVEMVRAGLADGGRLRISSGLSGADQRLGEKRQASSAMLPPKLHALIHARLAQLSPQGRELVDLAATIGRSFTFAVLAQASAGDGEALVSALDELWQRRIIREQEVDAYDFSHDKIREVAYTSLSRARQKLLHRRVAQALERVHAADPDPVSGQIAAHFEQAGLLEPAVRHYRRAAEMARRVYANHEAKVLYSRAIEASRQMATAQDDVQLLPVYEGRALVYRSLTQLDDAIADFQSMRRIAHAAGNLQKEAESLCQLAYTHWLTFAEEQMAFVEQYAREAMALFAESGDSTIRARSLTMLGAVDQVHRKMTDAGQKLKEALEISRYTQDKEALVQTLSFLCLQTHLQGNFKATVQFAQEGVAIARSVQDDFNELRIQAFLCQGQWSVGDYPQAFKLLQAVMTQAEERGNRYVQGRLLNTLGWFHNELCDFASAVAFNQQSVEVGRASGVDNVEISALVNLGYDYLALGQANQALACLEPTLERVEREGFGAHKWRWRMKLLLGLGEHAYSIGTHEQALRYVEAGLAEALSTSSQKYVAKGTALRSKILMQLGKTEAAGVDLQRACALADQLRSPSLAYPLAYALGQWYEMMGEIHQAAALYARAKALIDRMAAAVGDGALAARFLQSEPVQMISESRARTL